MPGGVWGQACPAFAGASSCRAGAWDRRQRRNLQHRQRRAVAAAALRRAGRLVRLFHVPPQSTFPGMPRFSLVGGEFLRLATRAPVRSKAWRCTGFAGSRLTGGGSGASRFSRAPSVPASSSLLRARPAIGRTFLPEEDTPARGHVVDPQRSLLEERISARRRRHRRPDDQARRRGRTRLSA